MSSYVDFLSAYKLKPKRQYRAFDWLGNWRSSPFALSSGMSGGKEFPDTPGNRRRVPVKSPVPGTGLPLRRRGRFHPAGGVTSQFRAGFQVKFFLEAAAVSIHGFGAYVELPGDGMAVFALADQLEDFQFAIRELSDGGTGFRASTGLG